MKLSGIYSSINAGLLKLTIRQSFLLLLLVACQSSQEQYPSNAAVMVTNLTCEYQPHPIGVDKAAPLLSWQLTSAKRNQSQTAYRILVSDDSIKLASNEGTIWDSHTIQTAQSIQVTYSGKALHAAKKYYWKVMVWDNHKAPSAWSEIASWQMGLLTKENWKNAQWIGLEKIKNADRIVPALHATGDAASIAAASISGKNKLPVFRKEISIGKSVKSATAFVCGLGHFELFINGSKVGDHFLDPGWTLYSKYAQYVSFDITNNLQGGSNVLAVMLGNGMYNIPGERYKKIIQSYGYPAFIGKIIIEYADGSSKEIVSDTTWKTTAGPLTFSSIYGGEDYNATLLQQGWLLPNFGDADWQIPLVVDAPATLVSQQQEPLKIMDSFPVKKITHPAPGTWVYDMGQNASAVPQITLTGKRGKAVVLTTAELLGDSGFVYQSSVGEPVYFTYTLSGDGNETWHPQFTYHGFRYIQVKGAVPEGEENPDGLPVIHKLMSLHVRNAAETSGTFTCSDTLFNRIDTLINWSIKSNMASVLTDCPHREKLGWLEESYLMGQSVAFNYNIASLYKKAVADMKASQLSDGLVPDIAPEYVPFTEGFRDSPEWGSASVMLPWQLYKWYGDKKVLSDNYKMIKSYVGYLTSKADHHLLFFGLGDWYDLGPKDPGESQLTPRGITATATYYYDLKIAGAIATLLGKSEDAASFAALGAAVRTAFNNRFFNRQTMEYGTGSQTAYAMAIYTGLVEPQYKQQVFKNLLRQIQNSGYALSAGDIGFHYLISVLQAAGASDIIYKMNSNSNVPGYGYQLRKGATSLTESWAALTYVSNNHLMLGHLMQWFYDGLCGIQQSDVSTAYKNIIIKPEPTGDITAAGASYQCMYGAITSSWKKTSSGFELTTTIPVNTQAIVYLPANNLEHITEDGKPVKKATDIQFIKMENGKAVFKVGSGKYFFKSKNP